MGELAREGGEEGLEAIARRFCEFRLSRPMCREALLFVLLRLAGVVLVLVFRVIALATARLVLVSRAKERAAELDEADRRGGGLEHLDGDAAVRVGESEVSEGDEGGGVEGDGVDDGGEEKERCRGREGDGFEEIGREAVTDIGSSSSSYSRSLPHARFSSICTVRTRTRFGQATRNRSAMLEAATIS